MPKELPVPTDGNHNGDLIPPGISPGAAVGMPQQAGFPGGPMEEDEPSINWRRYLAAVFRYKLLVLALTVLGTAGGVLFAKTQSPMYRAVGTIWVEGEDQESRDRGPIRSGQLLDTSSWVQLLTSFEVLEYVAIERRLFLVTSRSADRHRLGGLDVDREFVSGRYLFEVDASGGRYTLTLRGQTSETGALGDSVGVRWGLRWVPTARDFGPGSSIEFTLRHPRDAAAAVAVRLDPQMSRGGNFMTVQLLGEDPEATAGTLNSVLNRYIDLATDLKRARLTAAREILDGQLSTAQQNLQDAEVALERFKVNTITLPTERNAIAAGVRETRDPVIENFFRMKVEQEEIRRDREAIDRVLALRADSGIPVDQLALIQSARNSPELQNQIGRLLERRAEVSGLRTRYTDEHPLVRRVLDDLRTLEDTTIPRQLRMLSQALSDRETQLELQVNSASANLQQIPERTIEQTRLERGVEIATNLYTDLRQRAQAAHLAEASSLPDVSVLSRAVVPQMPFVNRAPLIVAGALAASLVVGVIVALLLDHIDRRVRYPEQITGDLGLQILGIIPRANGSRRGLRGPAINQIVESLRGIRLNMIHACGGHGPFVVTVTSPGPGDGKTFVSSNLALAFAEAGHRTILLDGDIRKGQLHRLFNLERRPGLTELLSGQGGAADVIRKTEFSQLDIVACGKRSSRAPELLGSATMQSLLQDLRTRYAVIIIDSPPLGAGIDAFALGSMTGNMLMVLRTGTTDREMAEAKLDTMDRLPIKVVGAVLNDVRPGRGAGYNYGYYSYYLPGYEADDEDEAAVAGTTGLVRRNMDRE